MHSPLGVKGLKKNGILFQVTPAHSVPRLNVPKVTTAPWDRRFVLNVLMARTMTPQVRGHAQTAPPAPSVQTKLQHHLPVLPENTGTRN